MWAELKLNAVVEEAAERLHTPSKLFREVLPSDESSSILFVRPHRPNGLNGIDSSEKCTFSIPTAYLSSVSVRLSASLANESSLRSFRVFSLHSMTRSAAGWVYERAVHYRLCSGGDALPIYRPGSPIGTPDTLMSPTTNLRPGTAAGLKQARPSTSFYWIPSSTNFPGVDGVLGDARGNVYAVQATIAEDHSSPVDGLKTIWGMTGHALRDGGHWRFVVVADTKAIVDKLVAKFSKDLKNVYFGRRKTSMEVWGCVFPLA